MESIQAGDAVMRNFLEVSARFLFACALPDRAALGEERPERCKTRIGAQVSAHARPQI